MRMRSTLCAIAIAIVTSHAACARTEYVATEPNETNDPPSLFVPPAIPDSGDGGGACAGLGCNMVDILFVVDNSISMEGAQRRLNEAFPAFLKQFTTQLKDTDFHLMVVDTDASGYEQRCSRSCPTADFDGSIDDSDQFCKGVSCASLFERVACDVTLGAGVVFPVGTNSSNRNCSFPEGRRYLTSKDDNLEDRFLCSASVGTVGSGDEKPIGAMLAALEAETQKGGCNEGFLRDDALLLVVIVSDASSTATELDPALALKWRERLLALKCGREEGVVVTTISHDGSQIAPWYSNLMSLPNDLGTQWSQYCAQAPADEAASAACCCACDDSDPFSCPPNSYFVCAECATTTQPPPWKQCWFYFTGYGTALTRFADAFGERGTHREICDDFSDVLDGTLETVKKACVSLK